MNNTEQQNVDNFFRELGDYYRRENDLSNVTVALCNSSEWFRNKFLKFFFDNISLDDVVSIRREVWDADGAGSRVDIYIAMRTIGDDYIIEVKIYDCNHHPEYMERFPLKSSDHFGYITNYYCPPEFDAIFKTWSDFYDELYKAIQKENLKDSLIRGYLVYLKKVCNIKKYYTPMRLDNIASINQLLDITDEIVADLEANPPKALGGLLLQPYRGTTDIQKKPLAIARRFGILDNDRKWLLNGYLCVDMVHGKIAFSANGDVEIMTELYKVLPKPSDLSCYFGYPIMEMPGGDFVRLNNCEKEDEQKLILKEALVRFVQQIIESKDRLLD